MKTLETIILRALIFVPVAIIHLLWAVRAYIKVMFLFCQYGGEDIIYHKNRKSIADVYDLLEKSLNKNNQTTTNKL